MRTPGRLKRLDHCGASPVTVYENTDLSSGPVLDFPGGVVIGLDGAAYVTNKTLSSGGGEVLRISLND